MIILDQQTQCEADMPLLEQICAKQTDKDIELLLVDSDTIRGINKEHRSKDCTTDVLSFPLQDLPHLPLGSIIINTDLASSVAAKLGHTTQAEIALLFAHGLLHLLGFDHERDSGEMRDAEEQIIKSFTLPRSLIIRTQQ